MVEPVLDGPRVVAGIGQGIAAGVPQAMQVWPGNRWERAVPADSDLLTGRAKWARADALGDGGPAMRQIPQQMASLKAGHWQMAVGATGRGKTLGIFGYGRIGSQVAEYGRTFGMNVVTSFSETVQGAAERGSTDLFVVPNWSPLARPDREDNGTGGGNYVRHIAARRTSAREMAIIP